MTSSSGTRIILWQHMLDIARWNRYYSILYKSELAKSTIIQCLLACSAVGVVAGLLKLFPEEWRHKATIISGAAIPFFVIVNLVFRWAQKAAVLQVISSDMSDVERSYRSLWETYHLGQISESDALSKSDKLLKRGHAICSRDTSEINHRVNMNAVEEVYTVERQRYAAH